RRGMLRYFSFATLTTLGDGDIQPVSPIARSLAILEALFGQLYPAVMIARLISLEIVGRRRSAGVGQLNRWQCQYPGMRKAAARCLGLRLGEVGGLLAGNLCGFSLPKLFALRDAPGLGFFWSRNIEHNG